MDNIQDLAGKYHYEGKSEQEIVEQALVESAFMQANDSFSRESGPTQKETHDRINRLYSLNLDSSHEYLGQVDTIKGCLVGAFGKYANFIPVNNLLLNETAGLKRVHYRWNKSRGTDKERKFDRRLIGRSGSLINVIRELGRDMYKAMRADGITLKQEEDMEKEIVRLILQYVEYRRIGSGSNNQEIKHEE